MRVKTAVAVRPRAEALFVGLLKVRFTVSLDSASPSLSTGTMNVFEPDSPFVQFNTPATAR